MLFPTHKCSVGKVHHTAKPNGPRHPLFDCLMSNRSMICASKVTYTNVEIAVIGNSVEQTTRRSIYPEPALSGTNLDAARGILEGLLEADRAFQKPGQLLFTEGNKHIN